MTSRFAGAIVAMIATLAWTTSTGAQHRPKANWLTDGGDPQRTSWQKHETLISPATAKHMKLAWKLRLDSQPRQLHNLFPPLIVSDVKTPVGLRQIGVVAAVSDTVFGIDLDTGKELWKRHFDSTFQEPAGGRGAYPLCPGGLTATPVVAPTKTPGKFIVYAISWDGRLRQLDVATGQEIAPAEPFLPPNGKPYGLNLVNNVIYTTTAQGCGGNPNQFYGYDLATKKVGSFNPGSGGLWPRLGPSIGKDGSVYAGSGDGDYFPEEQIFGQSIIGVKQNPATKALEMSDWFTPTNAVWLRKRDLDLNTSGPIFDYKGKEYIAQSSKECRIWLLDTSALGGEDHRTPVYRTPLVCNEEVQFASAGVWGALSTWEDADGTRWILMPFWGPKHSKFSAPLEYGQVVQGAIAAFRVEEKAERNGANGAGANGAGANGAGAEGVGANGTSVQLTPAWISRNMVQADPAVIANGVVFGFGNGEDATQSTPDIGLAYNKAENRIANSTHATLYALDARTGAELWSSGDQITSFNHFTSLSVANGRVYIGTFDGTLYAFGVENPGGTR
jgi:outer membrane protein assembly factor BamB